MAAINAPNNVSDILSNLAGVQIISLGTVSLTPTDTNTPPYKIDFAIPTLQGQLQTLGAIYVNNWENDATVYVLAPATSQIVIAPPFSVGWYPLAVPMIAKLAAFIVPTRASVVSASVSLCVSSASLAQGPFFNQNYVDGPPLTNVVIAAGAGTIDIVPAVAGQVVRLWRGRLSSAGTVTVLDNGVPLTGNMTAAPLNFEFNERPYFTSTAGAPLQLQLSALTQGYVQYTQGP